MGIFNRKKTLTDEVQNKVKDTKIVKKTVIDDIDKEVKKVVKEKKEIKQDKKIDNQNQIAYRILLHPIISEKSSAMASENKYIFEVSPRANKIEIKKAIEETYNVVPQNVNIINQRGKAVRFGRTSGYTKSYKKAIVTLKKGDSIKLYEGI